MEDLCTACLCAGRKLYFISDTGFQNLYSQIINEIPVYSIELCVRVCWECKALLRRVGDFKEQVKRCYTELLAYVQQNISRPFPTSPRLQTQHGNVLSYPDIQRIKTEADDVMNEDYSQNDDCYVKSETHCEPDTFVNDLCVTNENKDKTPKEKKSKKKPKLKSKKNRNKPKVKKKSKKELKNNQITKTVESIIDSTVMDCFKESTDPEKESIKSDNDSIDGSDRETTDMEYKDSTVPEYKISTDFKGSNPEFNDLTDSDYKDSTVAEYKNPTISEYNSTVSAYKSSTDPEYNDSTVAQYKNPTITEYNSTVSEFKNSTDPEYKHSTDPEYKESTDMDYYKGDDTNIEVKVLKGVVKKIKSTNGVKPPKEVVIKEPPLPEKPTCVECGKTFSSRKTYRYHLNVLHKGQNNYPCPRCGKVYQWKSNLGRHIRTHKARDSGELYCETCDKRFASVATYRQHLRISRRHVSESEFNFMCNECGKKFVNKTRLRDHIDWEHLKKIKFKCHLCHKPFKCHTSLYVHVQNVHTSKDKKENLCHVCGKSYQNSAKLKYHIVAMHTSETPYQCNQCEAAFGWYSSLYRHIKEVHYKMKVQPKKSKKAKKTDLLPGLLPVMTQQIVLPNIHQAGPP